MHLPLKTIFIACLSLSLSGCAVFQWVAIIFFPIENKALHELKEARTLVWYEFKAPASELRPDILSHYTVDRLSDVLEPELLLTHEHLREAEPDQNFGGLTIAAVGLKVDADQVIYVKVHPESLEIGPGYFAGSVKAHIRIINARSGRRIFPVGASHAGFPLVVKLPQRMSNRTAHSLRVQLRDELEQELASQVAQLFITYVPEPHNRRGKYYGGDAKGPYGESKVSTSKPGKLPAKKEDE